MSKETAARLAVRDSLIHLVEINQRFSDGVKQDHPLPIWVMKDAEEQNDRQLAAAVSTRLTYVDQQNKQETARLPGIVGISEKTFVLGHQLNLARDDFKTAMSAFRKLFGDSIEVIEQTSDDLREGLLGGLKIQHLHFVQCYRQLKLFEQPPRRIGFSWASSHSGTVRLSAKEAVEHFQTKYLASAAITQDIKLLQGMPGDETVVIKRVLAPHLRANITWSKEIKALRQTDKPLRKQFPAQINTPLPVFIKMVQGQPLPEFTRIKPFDPGARQERLQRSDARLVKINDNPHSRIYRYS